MRSSNPRRMNKLTLAGFSLLVVASVFHYLTDHQLLAETDWTDLLQGLLYGLCIGSLLVGLRRGCRPPAQG